MSHIMGEELTHMTHIMEEESKLLTGLPAITLPNLDLNTIIVVLAIQVAFFVGKYSLEHTKSVINHYDF